MRKKVRFQGDKPAILYYLSTNKGEAYKIGITNRSVEERFCKYELSNIEIINTEKYLIGVGFDLSSRIKAEEALRESEANLNSIFRVAPSGIGVLGICHL